MGQLFLSDFFGFLNLNEEKKTWDFLLLLLLLLFQC